MYRKILVPFDGSTCSRHGLEEAIRLADDQKAVLRIVHVIDQLAGVRHAAPAPISAECIHSLCETGRQTIGEALNEAAAFGVSAESVLHERTAGTVADWILREAATWGADLIVMGTHGRHNLRHMLLGSTAETVVRSAEVPVLLICKTRAFPQRQKAGPDVSSGLASH